MKIQCDVCDKDEAAVYCVADEAALCSACDHRVHHANKLAGKHHRFTLQNPSAKQVPLCDICHEKRAFLFCQQDRAILCKDCDGPIHKANEHTQKHSRYLLTGVKLSPTSTLYSDESSTPTSNAADNVPNLKPNSKSSIPAGGTPSTAGQSAAVSQVGGKVPNDSKSPVNGGDFSGGFIDRSSQSSISEYLIETLPGWHVEDFLDSSFPSPYGLSQSGDGGYDLQLPFWDGGDLDSNYNNGFSSGKKMGFGVPQVNHNHYSVLDNTQINPSMELLAFGGNKEQSKDFNANNSRKWSEDKDGSFLVPQINHNRVSSKRSRTMW